VWETGEARDLSLKMLLLLASGLALRIAYGAIRGDIVIISANAVSLALLSCIIFLKLRGGKGGNDEVAGRNA
jgi:MtN3 and saliva related transmembrane protein